MTIICIWFLNMLKEDPYWSYQQKTHWMKLLHGNIFAILCAALNTVSLILKYCDFCAYAKIIVVAHPKDKLRQKFNFYLKNIFYMY